MTHPRFIVSGTDTGIGKTVFAATLARAIGAHYWKPVQSGQTGETDSAVVMRLGGLPAERIVPEIWQLKTPASPHLSAELDGVAIDADALTPPDIAAPLVIEGVGGLMVPLDRNSVLIDVFARWQVPVVLCARTTLGTINHSLLSIEALRTRGIPIHGIVFLGAANSDNEATVAAMGKVRRLGRLPRVRPIEPDTLAEAFAANFDVADFA